MHACACGVHRIRSRIPEIVTAPEKSMLQPPKRGKTASSHKSTPGKARSPKPVTVRRLFTGSPVKLTLITKEMSTAGYFAVIFCLITTFSSMLNLFAGQSSSKTKRSQRGEFFFLEIDSRN